MPTHNTTGWGADVDALFDLAAFLESQKTHFEAAQRRLLSDVRAVEWFGPDAEDFKRSVTKYSDLKLSVSCNSLEALAKHLRDNATAQGVTSAAGSGKPFSDTAIGIGIGAADAERRANQKVAKTKEWDETLTASLASLAGASSAQISAWWSLLGSQKQEYYLKQHNVDLLQLRNAPPELQTAIEDAYRKDRAEHIPISSESMSLHGEVSIKCAQLSADVGGKVTEFADGHAEVDLNIGGELGVGLSAKAGSGADASMGIGVGLSQTYTFKNREEANKFLQGLKKEVTAIDRGDVFATVQAASMGAGSAGLIASQVVDIDRYLHGFKRTSNEVNLEVTAKASIDLGDNVKFDLSGKAGVKYDSDEHTTKIYRETEASVAAQAFGLGASGKVSMGAEFTVAGNDPAAGELKLPRGAAGELKLSATIEGTGGLDLKKVLGSMGPNQSESHTTKAMGGFRASVEATINVTDPVMKPLVAEYLTSVKNGDLGGQAAAIQKLYAAAEVQVRVDTVAKTESNYGVSGVAEVSLKGEVAHASQVWEKPKGGTFVNMLRESQ
jgi:hypothetical protein